MKSVTKGLLAILHFIRDEVPLGWLAILIVALAVVLTAWAAFTVLLLTLGPPILIGYIVVYELTSGGKRQKAVTPRETAHAWLSGDLDKPLGG
jgi:hypothetical protein